MPTLVDDAAAALAPEATLARRAQRFARDDRDPLEVVLKYQPAATEEPEPAEEPTEDDGASPPPAVDLGPTDFGQIVTPTPPVADVPPIAEVAAPPAPLAAAPYALLNSPWYTYRGVVFLPLALLVMMSLTGRSLTRPLTGGRGRRS